MSKERQEICLVAYDRVLVQDSDNIPQLAMTKATQAMVTARLDTIGQAQAYGNSPGFDFSNSGYRPKPAWTSSRNDWKILNNDWKILDNDWKILNND